MKQKRFPKVKKNIDIFKKDKTVKIKLTSKEPKKKSMEDALKLNEVLLWGLNRIDSILMAKYPNIKKNNCDKVTNKKNVLDIKNELLEEIQKTLDTEYNPSNTYNICDLDFLNLEYDRIEKKISQMLELNDEYNNLLDLQDSLTELINELTEQSKENNQDTIVQNPIADIINNADTNTNDTNDTNDNQVIIEVEIDKNKKKYTKSIKSTRNIKTKKLKPYYFIGEIPEGYREATEEEAIVNKKVSFYGKKKVNRELNSLFEITGTIYMDMTDKKELNKQIMALKGKLTYYKKEIEYHKISLDSDINTEEMIKEIKDKIYEVKNYYKKTLDIYNIYVSKFNELNCKSNIKIDK